jgi:hypothetical protein
MLKHQHNHIKIYFIYRNFLPYGQADLTAVASSCSVRGI